MALKMLTGFETGGFLEGWVADGATVTTAASRAGSGAYGLQMSAGNQNPYSPQFDWTVATETIYLGFAMRSTAATPTILGSIGADGTGAGDEYFATWEVQTDGSIDLYAADTPGGKDSLVGSSPVSTFQSDTWQYYEIVFLCDDSSGVLQLWVDGVQQVNFSGDTAIDSNANRANANDKLYIQFNGHSVAGNLYIDDMYLCGNTAAGNDPFTGRQGDIQIEGLKPTADTAQKDFTTTETNNYQAVEDVPLTTAQYNSSSTANHEDRFTLANRTHTGTPLGVAYHVTAEKDAANTRQINALLTSGGTKDVHGPHALANGAPKTFSKYHGVNPDTGVPAWTNTSVNAIEVGYDVE